MNDIDKIFQKQSITDLNTYIKSSSIDEEYFNLALCDVVRKNGNNEFFSHALNFIHISDPNDTALNIKSRVSHKELRAKLNRDNVYPCSRPKPIYYRSAKNIIYEVYKIGVVTELLPENMVSRIQSKEASPFRAG